MNIKNIRGLKYPDEYFIKFFFKYNLHNKSNQKYLELGCANGCNLMLPYQFDNDIIGVDLNKSLIDFANYNFNQLDTNNSYSYVCEDMRKFCQNETNINTDVLVLANSIYYIPKNDFINLLKNIKNKNLIKTNIPFFIRFRLPNDFRNNKGKVIEKNSIIIDNGITGEDGAFCKFYEINEMTNILKEELNLKDFQTMEITYDNIQNNTKVKNYEAVIWGTVN